MCQMLRSAAIIAFGCLALFGCNKHTEAAADGPAMLAVGTSLPSLVGVDKDGKEIRLSPSSGKRTLVYFYPKDGTPGCTKEACAFRDVWQRFEQANVLLYGVSRDDPAAHSRFAIEHHIPFPLVSDVDGKWANAFGVPIPNGKSKRVSFLFDSKGKLVTTYPNVDPGVHADQVLRDVAATN